MPIAGGYVIIRVAVGRETPSELRNKQNRYIGSKLVAWLHGVSNTDGSNGETCSSRFRFDGEMMLRDSWQLKTDGVESALKSPTGERLKRHRTAGTKETTIRAGLL